MKNKIIVIFSIVLVFALVFVLYEKSNTPIFDEELQVNEPVETENLGIFNDYYEKAQSIIDGMTTDELLNQLLLVRYEEGIENSLDEYPLGGIIFFAKDFKNKTKEDVLEMVSNLQEKSKIPLLTAVDEEGGIVNRISVYSQLVDKPFLSSQALYKEGGFELIKEDTINKSSVLSSFGINLNLAPVVDVSTNKSDYIYSRTLGLDASHTAEYAKTVIEASKGTDVSYTLKHFPGYGNNKNTHTGISKDMRECSVLNENDLVPFIEGIKSGAEAILVSHNIVYCFDEEYPASLSRNVHDYLKETLEYTGIIMTDGIDMDALKEYGNAAVLSIKAGNDLIITTNYKYDVASIKDALDDASLSLEEIKEHTVKVIAWKLYKGLM